MRKCRFCEKEIQNASTVCEHCGRDLIPGRKTEPVDAPPATIAPTLSAATTSTDPDEDAPTVAMLASVKTRLTVLIALGCLVLLGQVWQTVMGITAHRQTWEYAIEAPADEELPTRLLALGVGGWEIVSARRATSDVDGKTKASYEMILRRPLDARR